MGGWRRYASRFAKEIRSSVGAENGPRSLMCSHNRSSWVSSTTFGDSASVSARTPARATLPPSMLAGIISVLMMLWATDGHISAFNTAAWFVETSQSRHLGIAPLAVGMKSKLGTEDFKGKAWRNMPSHRASGSFASVSSAHQCSLEVIPVSLAYELIQQFPAASLEYTSLSPISALSNGSRKSP